MYKCTLCGDAKPVLINTKCDECYVNCIEINNMLTFFDDFGRFPELSESNYPDKSTESFEFEENESDESWIDTEGWRTDGENV